MAGPQEDDAVLEEAAVDVPRALPAGIAFDNVGDDVGHGREVGARDTMPGTQAFSTLAGESPRTRSRALFSRASRRISSTRARSLTSFFGRGLGGVGRAHEGGADLLAESSSFSSLAMRPRTTWARTLTAAALRASARISSRWVSELLGLGAVAHAELGVLVEEAGGDGVDGGVGEGEVEAGEEGFDGLLASGGGGGLLLLAFDALADLLAELGLVLHADGLEEGLVQGGDGLAADLAGGDGVLGRSGRGGLRAHAVAGKV
jgi:hypothetical protein